MKKIKKVVVITGGNSGLGKATAKILSKNHDVVIIGKNSVEIKQTSKELNCEGLLCDVTDENQLKNTFSKILKKYKKVDCLINCAGVWIKGPIEENKPNDIKNAILVNTAGTILTVNAIASQFKNQGNGRIINVSSRAGLNPRPERSVYTASKWAITGFTKSLQLELMPFNISVVGFYPGFIHTDLFEKAGDNKENYDSAMPVEKVAKNLAYLVDIDEDIVVNSFEIQSIKEFKK
jgi:NADP-dependent 3-hydroxy acid dehydrogenase YdfG